VALKARSIILPLKYCGPKSPQYYFITKITVALKARSIILSVKITVALKARSNILPVKLLWP
jgi:hypothetical protein